MLNMTKLLRVIKACASGKLYTAMGMEMSLSQWSAYSNIGRNTLDNRIKQGWSVERAVTESATVGNNQHLRY